MNRVIDKNGLMVSWLVRYRIHFLVWAAFIFWESVIIGVFFNIFGKLGNYVCHYAANILLFYVHAHLLQRAVNSNGRGWKVPLFSVGIFSLYVLGVFYMDIFLSRFTDFLSGALAPTDKRILTLIWRGSFFMLFSTGYFFIKRYLSEKEENQRNTQRQLEIMLEKERAEKALVLSRNAFLRSQINPHLLFNTFEMLRNRVSERSVEEAKIMTHLSDMVRFAAESPGEYGLITIGEEIAQCENLIQVFRFTKGALFVKIGFAPDVEDLKLIPLVLLTLLENIFKHGDNTDAAESASLDVFSMEGCLRIETRNKPSQQVSEIGFGSGLRNVQERLAYAYQEDFSMSAGMDQDGDYGVQIAIELSALKVNLSAPVTHAIF